MVGIGGEVGLSLADDDMCLRVQVDGSAGLSFEGGLQGEVMPTPMPAIDPCLAPRDNGPLSTPSIDRTAGGGVAVRLFLVAVGLSGLPFFSPSNAAMTSSRSSSSADSRLMTGVSGARARFGELLLAMMAAFRSMRVLQQVQFDHAWQVFLPHFRVQVTYSTFPQLDHRQ